MSDALRQTRLIAARELRALFTTPLYWVLTGLFFLASAWVFIGLLFGFANQEFLDANNLAANVNIAVIQQIFGVAHFFLLVQIPLLTMRAFAEERRTGTFSLLQTLPTGEWPVVLGKFLANAGVMLTYLALTLVFPLITAMVSDPEWPFVVSCYTALVLAVFAYVALGLFFSSLTESQVVAAVLTYVALFGLLLFGSIADAFPSPSLERLASHLTLLAHVEGFLEGNVSLADIAYFLGLAGLGLFFAVRQVESLRWRS